MRFIYMSDFASSRRYSRMAVWPRESGRTCAVASAGHGHWFVVYTKLRAHGAFPEIEPMLILDERGDTNRRFVRGQGVRSEGTAHPHAVLPYSAGKGTHLL